MGFNMKDLKKELFNAALITSSVEAVGFVAKKAPLGHLELLKEHSNLVLPWLLEPLVSNFVKTRSGCQQIFKCKDSKNKSYLMVG